jgi:cystathionine gamma-synthase
MTDRPARDTRSIVRRSGFPASGSTPVVTPLHPSVVWAIADADALDAQYEGRAPGFAYAREGHPNWAVLAQKLDWLEGVTPAMGQGAATSSGMAAVTAALLGLLSAGDHLVAADQLYGRTLRFLRQDLPRFGIAVSFVDASDAGAVEAALRPETRAVLVEVVSNPTLRIADMDGIGALARARGLILMVDNTFTTPRGWPAFARGANVVIQSVTKLLAGHSDATLGWVAADAPERNRAIRDMAVTLGMTPSPFDCWLAERGLHTFDLRYARACANAAVLADALAEAPGVARVLYPGRADHPDHARAEALLGGRWGNMLSFELSGGRAAANAFLRAAAPIPFAPTLGDVATTVSHPASSSHRGLTPEGRAALGISEGFIRVSVGIEDAAQLVGEFGAAVAAAEGAGA